MAKSSEPIAPAHSPVSLNQAKQIVRAIVESHLARDKNPLTNRRPNVPMLWGHSGIGKTSGVYQIEQELGFDETVMIRAGELRPEDLTGPPFPYKEGYSEFHPPRALLELTKEWHAARKAEHDAAQAELKAKDPNHEVVPYEMPKPRFLLLDELPNASIEMQAPLHSLILDGKLGVGNHTLLDNVFVIATGNEAKHGAFVNELSAPIRARIAPHLDVHLPLPDWVVWGRANNVHPTILSFIPQNEDLFHNFDERSASFTFASARTWTMASDVMRSIGDDPDLLFPSLQGSIGSEAAAQFVGYLETARKAPTADQIAADPLNTPTFDDEPDIAIVAMENMLAGVRRKPANADAYIQYGARMHKRHQEVFFPLLLNLDGNMPPEVITAVVTSEHFSKVVQGNSELKRVMDEGAAAMAAPSGEKAKTTRKGR